jgi:ABC-2 type transport system permease protein
MTETVDQRSDAAGSAAGTDDRGGRWQWAEQAAFLARRSIVSTFRQPAVWIPGVLFPLMIAAVNSAAFDRATRLPGFPPVDSFFDFVMAATIVQGVLFGGVAGGSDIALDIESGFFERLVASPVARSSILIGRLAGAGVQGAVQVLVFTLVFGLLGVRVAGGVAGVLVLIAVAVVLAVAIGGLGAAVGLRTGQAEAVQNSFPLVFILLFISSAFFPTALMRGWYKTVATHNPMTWLVDGMRHQVIVGFDAVEALKAFAVAGGLCALALTLAASQLRRRLAVAS